MRALAEVLVACGHRVSGSDRFFDQGEDLEVFEQLRAAGVELVPQNGSAIRPGLRAVVVSAAIEAGNPELVAAARVGVPVTHRAELLARLCEGKSCVAIAGTAGKTTIAGMVGWILERAGRDPTVVGGGAVMGWVSAHATGHARAGKSDIWVVETDESDRSLLRFRPEWAAVANISRDHFEVGETVDLFRAFARQVRRRVVCGPGVADAIRGEGLPGRLLREVPRVRACAAKEKGGWVFEWRGAQLSVPLLGRHNVENATIAVALSEELGVALDRIRDGLATFPGIRRRLEVVGQARGVTVVDDYAHNPAKIAAAWKACREVGQRVAGVWRPHGFGPLAAMRRELWATWRACMKAGDLLLVLPVYYAGGTAERRLTAEEFVAELAEGGVAAEFAPSYDAVAERLAAHCRAGDVVLCMGARDPGLPGLARALVRRLAR